MRLLQLPSPPGAACWFSGRPSRASRGHLRVDASLTARWFGVKSEALALLQEWVRDVGSHAGLNSSNTRILSGAIGCPESRLELEVTLDGLAELEELWATLPPAAHAAWSQRARGVLLDGSPRWDVMRVCPVLPYTSSPAAVSTSAGQGAVAATAASPAVSPPTPPLRVPRGVNPWKKGGPKPVSAADEDITELPSGLVVPAQDSEELPINTEQMLDWKGSHAYDGCDVGKPSQLMSSTDSSGSLPVPEKTECICR